MNRTEELKAKIVQHYINNPGVGIYYKTLGTTWTECNPVYEELFAAGILETRKVPSKSGKTMQQKTFAVGY